jgi:hypothetical protein
VTTEPRSARRVIGTALGAAVTLALVAAAFARFDLVVASAVAIVLVTTFGMIVAASGWDQHSTYEEREAARARRRQEKWDRNKAARERDRRKWEAHQARQVRQDGDA